jgi:hypothetical protein
MEVALDTGGDLEGQGYRARVRFGERLGEPMTLEYRDVADNRGTLSWCAALAARVRELARALRTAGSTRDARAR